ncbi:SMC-Scp complex subunit ScpB [Pseudoclavibacter sp. RFBJ3]|uniref:SMC-Scp complex subunit ScpB n=1 Tax=unclassified Pseudoclavibacter TaxID=2615177 RepID=UPI000CE8B141|nr:MULTISPECIES: SMC-Scp complex subunit ScpB [unclassified Pseudoclavibacter]MBF4548628.1 SMC-Scp complex subunit ScpB [Pseudoclavibacter sp. VKM Ac-2888]PPF75194.1 SMC-Scp complex subunit ScpB [Pseudoclavibacter sp. Z016]PPF86126.1 SMC-Scp complex subunit ScpB [Pseudoclavibacter sp. RFBJ5]PPF92526.1 SMC-Scp complex subunit ScpB [Pseudoclavibacter sp. RFBJ3]PPF97398.1 SMC-Scp complex subunit ScpB [Pseudoclavibacter sp. RFBH5]
MTDLTATEQPSDPGEQPSVELDRAVEAILFVADEPLSLVTIAGAVSRPVSDVRASIGRLVADYNGDLGGPERGFELREVGGGWRLYVRETLDDIVADFVLTRQPSRLSQAALETLAVIAYRQPITRSQVAQVRAVNVDSVVRTLVARGLIAEDGHDDVTGAIRYVTTQALLVHLGLNSLDELPKISPLLDEGQDGFHE